MNARLPFALAGLLAAFTLEAAEPAPASRTGTYYGARAAEYPAWFKDSFLDLKADIDEAAQAGRRVVLLFTQDNCPYCAALVERNLSQRAIEATLKEKFDVVAVNLWGDREVVALDGKPYTEKTLGTALKVQFTPTLLFFDEAGNTVLRLNGYVPPARFQAALDWVGGHHENETAFRDFVAAREGSATGGGLEKHAYLRQNARDLRRRGTASKPLAVFFEQKDCPDCEVLHRRVLADPAARQAVAGFDAVQFDMWSKTPIITPAGVRLPVRDWVRKLGMHYAPGIVLFDADGREVIRWESSFRVFHTRGMFDYVSSGAYRSEPSFQRYLSARSERIREAWQDVNIWRYADEPLATP